MKSQKLKMAAFYNRILNKCSIIITGKRVIIYLKLFHENPIYFLKNCQRDSKFSPILHAKQQFSKKKKKKLLGTKIDSKNFFSLNEVFLIICKDFKERIFIKKLLSQRKLEKRISAAYSEPSQKSKMEHFAKKVNGFNGLFVPKDLSQLFDRVLNTPLIRNITPASL